MTWEMSKPNPLTRDVLDSFGCATPNCGHDHSTLFLHGACHLGAGNEVQYTKATGVLTIRCNQCKRFVAAVQVAK